MLKLQPKPIICQTSPWGLGNKLLCIATSLRICDILKRPMILRWDKASHCNCHFHDLFCDIPGVEVQTGGGGGMWEVDRDNVPWDTFTINSPDYVQFKHEKIHGGRGMIAYSGDIDLSPYFKKIDPLPHIKEEITKFVEENDVKNTVGIHFRGTDKGNNPWYDRYIRLIQKVGQRSKILLCTDDGDIERKIIEESGMGHRIVSYKKTKWTDKLDNREWRLYSPINRDVQCLIESVIDMWLLANTRVIVYGIGTFGVCAAHVNHVPKVPIALREHSLFLFYGHVDMNANRKEKKIMELISMHSRKLL